MSTWSDDFELLFNIQDLVQPIIYKNNEYRTIRYNRDEKTNPSPAGYSLKIDFELLIWINEFPILPKTGDVISYENEELRVKELKIDSSGRMAIVGLGGKYD